MPLVCMGLPVMPSSESVGATSLAGRTAVVTGGGSAIGQAIALLFARHGARVAILDLAADDAVRRIAGSGVTAKHLTCDVTKQVAVDAAFADIASSYGPVDVLVSCAGVAHFGSVELTSEEDFDRVY